MPFASGLVYSKKLVKINVYRAKGKLEKGENGVSTSHIHGHQHHEDPRPPRFGDGSILTSISKIRTSKSFNSVAFLILAAADISTSQL